MQYVFFKNKIIEEERARVPLATHALQYGTGVFDSIRGYWNSQENKMYLLKPREHFERLLNSAKIVGWQIPFKADEMIGILKSLIKKNNPKRDIYVRPFIFQSGVKLPPMIGQDFEPIFAMYMIELGDYLSTNVGLKAKISSWSRVGDNMIPPRAKVCGLYVNSALARKEAAEYGADEAIFLNQDGTVCEGSGENIFIVRGNVLITPPPSANILEGITRGCIIEIAKKEGIVVVERNIGRTELYIADEVFLAGTACQVAYFSKIDNRKVRAGRIGPITKKLQEIYFKAVHGKLPEYKFWTVRV